jgi:YidC/Oxa1 family membrane protein insertase
VSATTFLTQKQLMSKNMPADAMNNPFAQQQKILLYVFPLVFAVSGVNFPIGVLLYWLTTNVWSMCQQFYVIRKMPAPGSLAEKAMQDRRRKKGKPVEEFTVKGLDKVDDTEAPKASGQRVQPTRNKKKKGAAGPAKKPAPGSPTDPKPQTDN